MRISRWTGLGLLSGVGLLLTLGLLSWRRPAAIDPLLPALPQDPFIQVYFNHSQAANYTEPYRQQQRLGDDLEQVIIDAIDSARVSIDVAVQELRLPRVAQALRRQQAAGIKVRVIVENSYRRSLSQLTQAEVSQADDRAQQKYQEFVQLVDLNQDGQLSPAEIQQRDAIAILEAAQIPLLDDTADGSKGSGLMHHKFVVIDRQTVIVGSANFTTSDVHGDFATPASQGNANHLLKITSPALARIFSQEFALMWGDGVGGQSDSQFGVKKTYRPPQQVRLSANSQITVQFSPTSRRLSWEQSVNGLIGRTIDRAQQKVDLALFVFSDQPLSDRLQARQQRGVTIRALIEPSFAYRNYSELLDLLGISLPDNRCRTEADNRPWQTPIATGGMPALADGDLLHHKMAIVDGRIIITGSQNWSEAANRSNDENLLVIENPTVAAHFQREFDRLYQGAALGLTDRLQQKQQAAREQCGR